MLTLNFAHDLGVMYMFVYNTYCIYSTLYIVFVYNTYIQYIIHCFCI